MIIDKLKLDDFEKIKLLVNDYKVSINEEPLTQGQFIRLKKAIEEEKIIFYTVTEEEEIVAMCSITIGFSTYNCEYMGTFEDFYIKPIYRGKGLASKLTKFVFSQMDKKGVKSIWVGCSDVDVEMYKHLGFNVTLGNLLAWNKD